jgi:S-adenosylmethionine-dependent methyltransferase
VNSSFGPGEGQWTEKLGNLRNVVRQEIIARQIYPEIQPGMSVLDVGCGQGTQALRMAAAGCRVTGVDPSADLLRLCSRDADEMDLDIELINGRIEDLNQILSNRQFDLVCCHGVFMYLTERQAPLTSLRARLGERGRLSLTFRNAHALAMRPGLRSDWRKALAAFDSPEYINELGVPAKADRIEEVSGALGDVGLTIAKWYGVRIFNDALPVDAQVPDDDELSLILSAEERAGSVDPYRWMGSQIHVITEEIGHVGSPAPSVDNTLQSAVRSV